MNHSRLLFQERFRSVAAPHAAEEGKSWEDKGRRRLEYQLADVLVGMLVAAERLYREGLLKHRQWVIESKARAELEMKRRAEEAERQARQLQETRARERTARLMHEAKAFSRANQIRAVIDAVLLRAADIPVPQAEIDNLAVWARREADSIDPVKNGAIDRSFVSAARVGA